MQAARKARASEPRALDGGGRKLVAPFQRNSARPRSKNWLAFSGDFANAAGRIFINLGEQALRENGSCAGHARPAFSNMQRRSSRSSAHDKPAPAEPITDAPAMGRIHVGDLRCKHSRNSRSITRWGSLSG
jgi:hypothetical protein